MRVAILGAGPAGLTAACILSQNGVEVHLYESAPFVGGLAKTSRIFGEEVELGPHFFRSIFYESLIEWIPEIQSIKCREFKRYSKILFNNHYYNYPPSAKDILKNCSLRELIAYGSSFLFTTDTCSDKTSNAEGYLVSKMGRAFYTTFFQPYLEKIWGCVGSSIHEIFAAGLLGNDSLKVKNLIISSFKKSSPGSSGDVVYPEGGFSALWQKMAELINDKGGRIHTSCSLAQLQFSDRTVSVVTRNGEVETHQAYDHVVSTIPPLTLQKLLKEGKSCNLLLRSGDLFKFRNLIIVYVDASLERPFENHCVYIYDRDNGLVRITNLSAFKSATGKKAILSFEYWVSETDALWHLGKNELVERLKKDVSGIQILSEAVFDEVEVRKIPNAFLIPLLDMPEHYNNLNSHFAEYAALITTGRNASKNFNYSMEDAIKDGYQTAKDLLRQVPGKDG
jgi:protoporphyrinogen oxidase